MSTLTVLWGNLMRYLALACLIVGIVAAAMDKVFGGFTPIIWLLIAIFCMVTVTCTEVHLTKKFLERKRISKRTHLLN